MIYKRKTTMNLRKNITYLFFSFLSLLAVTACSDEDDAVIAGGKGYLQLRLFAEGTTRALNDMADAKKIELELDCDGLTVVQTLGLSSVPEAEGAGLITEKIELLTGDYQLMSYTIYGAVKPGKDTPEELAYGYPGDLNFQIAQGHLTEIDVNVEATLRGKISFNLIKDLSNYQEEMDKVNNASTRATAKDETLFQYDQIAEVDVTYKMGSQVARTSQAKVYLATDADYFHTDTLSLVTGEYTVTEVKYYDKKRQNLLLVTNPNIEITVAPNVLNKQDIDVTYPENMKAISDYMALYEIWKAMDGPNWSYAGETYVAKSNWKFDGRPIDEWGNQPGVQVNADGRVKSLDLGSFNAKGDIPEALGKLTELESLWLGKHDDDLYETESVSYKLSKYSLYHKGVDLRKNRLSIAREELALRHPRRKASPMCNQKKQAYTYAEHATYDVNKGDIFNGITSIPTTIKNLQKLEILYIANGRITNLPEELVELPNLTDMELYNCKLEEFPEALKKMQNIIALNLSTTSIEGDTDGKQMMEGLNALFNSSKNLQILYAQECGLTEFPMDILDAENLVMLDMTDNKLTKLPQKENAEFAPKFAPIQAFFDNNLITKVEQFFCGTNDIEKFSIVSNHIEEFPLLFNQGAIDGKYAAETIDFTDNRISKFPEDFKGIRTETLSLSWNPIGEVKNGVSYFPSAFAKATENGQSPERVSIQNLETMNCNLDSITYTDGFQYFKNLQAWDLSGNNLRYIPYKFNVETFPYLTGLNLSQNCFSKFPIEVFNVQRLYKLYISSQTDRDGNTRCLKEFPSGMDQVFGLRFLDVSGNDIRIISEEDFPGILMEFNVADNPNLEMTIPSSVCESIVKGTYMLGFDSDQYILGCPALDLDINK